MAKTETNPQVSAKKTRGAARRALSLALKGALLLTVAYGAAFALAWLVPEANNYARAEVLKHHRLAELDTKKIVLVGGSNWAYGTDSTVIEAETGCPAVNMGLNGYFGARFLMNEVAPDMNRGDIVVIAFEYDNYFKSVDGTSADLLTVVKADPPLFSVLTLKQRLGVLSIIPLAAQRKILRFMGEAYDAASGNEPEQTDNEEDRIWTELARIESAESYGPTGDLIGHLGLSWPGPREDGLDATTLPLDGKIIGLIEEFASHMEARGVHVVMSYTPAIRDYYDRHAASIDHLHELLEPLHPPSPPTTYVYDEPLFFDTVYHLNTEGRQVRTRQLIEDLRKQLGDDATCGSGGVAE